MNNQPALHELFAEYARGTIGPEQLATLQTALRESAELRGDFIEYMNLDSALADLAAFSSREAFELDGPREPCLEQATKRKATNRRRVLAVAGILAASLLLGLIAWGFFSGTDDRPTDPGTRPVTIEVVSRIDAVLLRDAVPWQADHLSLGGYTLERGLLHLKFVNGVTVFVEAPARFELASVKRLILHGGRLSANVSPQGVGFTVETPAAKVIDFGTEFSVEVESGRSEVHVFNGLVRVHPKANRDNQGPTAIDLRSSQAVRIDGANRPVGIELAPDRFIRNFDEPRRAYPRLVKQLSPVAYYRMPIRARGLYCEPAQYSGEVLLGEGLRPPHAPGCIGASLRVGGKSTGRGARVDTSPPLGTGRFTLGVWVYADSHPDGATVVTNILGEQGNFALSLDAGRMRATVRTGEGDSKSCTGNAVLPVASWRNVVVTADGKHLRLYEDGQLTASSECPTVASEDRASLWMGTSPEGKRMWDGRIDELAMYDRALTPAEIKRLHEAAPRR